ncbi:glycosyl hydrolase [Agromyces sp. MMS17-SY077]|uniref:Glycosyl hydrolase n=2 Tax=Agromyces seonyuensis TaxID=2662446 RepID=A0A6I4NX17_9MICO|nr:glycosyl hydrolase [Agromyces seonyuensis]
MTLEEKVGQLVGLWVGASADGEDVAPHQHDMSPAPALEDLLPNGLGQLTRPFGTAPVAARQGARSLARTQARIVASGRFGIPAIAHEECLAGFAAWGATAYPVPLSLAATFDPELVEEMTRRVGADLRAVGVHQGLAPVLDVVRDARWGRVEETMGEDPYLVGTIGTAYVRGLEGAGVVATLKHFVGYSASKAGRNLAPVSVGPRELADVLLPPFEMVIRDAAPRSVMNSYTDLDGVPTAADPSLLDDVLRERWGFSGTVVADYFSVAFLEKLHAVAGSPEEAAALALTAGIDVELPTVDAFGAAFVSAVRDGRIDEGLVDRALDRVLAQKIGLGMLDPDWSAEPADLEAIDLDSPGNRDVARRLAESAIVLVANDGTLPLEGAGRTAPRRIAIVGPTAEDPFAVLGCYSFPLHVGAHHPGTPVGIDLPSLREALETELPGVEFVHVAGTSIAGGERDGIAAAAATAADADLAIVALGDRAGLFGRGTSGEGCDVASLDLPGAQGELLDAVLDTGTPTIVALLSGRPYALGSAAERAAAIVQAFFAGQAGTTALAGILSGRVNPSGRLPVSIPARPGAQPSTYLAAPLGRANDVSNLDPSAVFPFGHGLGYARFEWSDESAAAGTVPVDGDVELALSVRNTGERAGADVVQLYLHDPIASVVRPVQRLVGFRRVELEPGASVRLTVRVPADLAAFTGRDGRRAVEPGALVFSWGRSSGELVPAAEVELAGPRREVGFDRALHPDWRVEAV